MTDKSKFGPDNIYLFVLILLALSALLILPMVFASSGGPAHRAQVNTDLLSLHTAFSIYEIENGTSLKQQADQFISWREGDSESILVQLKKSDTGFYFDVESLDDDGNLCDPWGNPYRYVQGNAKRALKKGIAPEEQLPCDTNKPMDAGIKSKDSSWNMSNRAGFAYIYSYGEGDSTTPDLWMYVEGD